MRIPLLRRILRRKTRLVGKILEIFSCQGNITVITAEVGEFSNPPTVVNSTAVHRCTIDGTPFVKEEDVMKTQNVYCQIFRTEFANGGRVALRIVSIHYGRIIDVAQENGYQDVENMSEKEIRDSLKKHEGFREQIADGLARVLTVACPLPLPRGDANRTLTTQGQNV